MSKNIDFNKLNYVGQQQNWIDHVKREKECRDSWQGKWGFTIEAYKEMNKSMTTRNSRLMADKKMFNKIELEDLPKSFPKTTSGEIGYLVNRKYPFDFR